MEPLNMVVFRDSLYFDNCGSIIWIWGSLIEISFVLPYAGVMGCGAAEATGPGFVCFVVLNPHVLSANRVDFGFLYFINVILPPPPPVSIFIVFVFVFLSSGFCLVLALVARICYCLFCLLRFTPPPPPRRRSESACSFPESPGIQYRGLDIPGPFCSGRNYAVYLVLLRFVGGVTSTLFISLSSHVTVRCLYVSGLYNLVHSVLFP